jgi:protein-disulfide isomerase
VGKAPTLGPKKALITVVVYGGLQCRYTRKAIRTLRAIRKARPKEMRLVFKHYPLRMHRRSLAAARAAVEAHKQGRFWRFLDRLAAAGWKLSTADLERAGRKAGLKTGSIRAALKAGRHRTVVLADKVEGARVRVRGTPTIFINGTRVSGAKPAAAFRKLIAAERKRARAMLRRKGVTRKNLYAKIIAGGIAPARPRRVGSRRAAPHIPRGIRRGVARLMKRPGSRSGNRTKSGSRSLDLGNVPALGAEGALVTVLLFTNFRCSYGNYIWDAFTDKRREKPGVFRLYFLQHRVRRHNRRARLAAEAALVAKAQGRFWEMAGILFHNRHGLTAKRLAQHAVEIGLDLKAYRDALAKGTYRQEIQRQVAQSRRFLKNTSRCPVVWINGRLLKGYISKWKLKRALDKAAREVQGIQARPLP